MLGIKAAGGKPPAAPEKSFADYFRELEKTGKTIVPCPHGHGTYLIKVEGSFWYGSPEIIFDSNENCPMPFGDPLWNGHSFRVHGGRLIAWYPKWSGHAYRPKYDQNSRGHNLQFAKMAVRIILAGRRLYLLRCGDSMSSLDNDEDLERKNGYPSYF